MLGLYIVLIVTATCLWYGSMLMFIIKLQEEDLLSKPVWYKLLWLVFVVFAPVLLPAYGAYYYFKQH